MIRITRDEAAALVGLFDPEEGDDWRLVVPKVQRHQFDDVADRYLVGITSAMPGGCIIYAESNGRWYVNPPNLRGLVDVLIGNVKQAEEADRKQLVAALAEHPGTSWGEAIHRVERLRALVAS